MTTLAVSPFHSRLSTCYTHSHPHKEYTCSYTANYIYPISTPSITITNFKIYTVTLIKEQTQFRNT